MTQQTPQALRPLPKKASPSHVHLLAPSPHQQVSLALGWEWGQHALSQAGRRLQLLGGGGDALPAQEQQGPRLPGCGQTPGAPAQAYQHLGSLWGLPRAEWGKRAPS